MVHLVDALNSTTRDSVGCSQTLQWRQQMSIFPTKILLATDGSKDANLAARAAIDLSKKAGSELHAVHVWHDVPTPHLHSFVRAQPTKDTHYVHATQVRPSGYGWGTPSP